METLKNLSLLEWIGIVILFNTTLIGGSSQLQDLMISAAMVKAILAIATLGNGFLGGLVLKFGGIRAQADAVVDAGGRIEVNAFATKPLAAAAMDESVSKIVPAKGADAALAKIAEQ